MDVEAAFARTWPFWWGTSFAGVLPRPKAVEPLWLPFKGGYWPTATLIVFPHYIKLKALAKMYFGPGLEGRERPETCEFEEFPKAEKAFGKVFYKAGKQHKKLNLEADHHAHACEKCFHIWSHPNAIRSLKAALVKKAHICPKCKTPEQTSIFGIAYQGHNW